MHDVDAVADHLSYWARVARTMPPLWRDGGISQPIVGPEGQRIGSMLPGKGLFLDCDLNRLGIKRKVPGVLERSSLQRRVERLLDTRGQITSLGGVQAALRAGKGQTIVSMRTPVGTVGARGIQSLFTAADEFGNSAAYPSSVSTMDQTSAGALNAAMLAPSGSDTAYLIGFGAGAPVAVDQPALYMIFDILVSMGGLLGTTNTAQTINTPTLTRYTSGQGVLFNLDVQVAPTGSTPQATVSYTNQAGTSGQVTPNFLVSNANHVGEVGVSDSFDAQDLFFPFLASGDTGCRSIQSITFASGLTAGTYALFMFYPLEWVAGSGAKFDWYEHDTTTLVHGLVPLQTSSGNLGCLQVAFFVSQAISPNGQLFTFKTVRG
jgi:hypothetical protein